MSQDIADEIEKGAEEFWITAEIAWIRFRYSLGWLVAVAATLLLLVGIYGMVASAGAVQPLADTLPDAFPPTVVDRLGVIAAWWPLSIPATAAAAWFSLKL